jgi:hypothetical protein
MLVQLKGPPTGTFSKELPCGWKSHGAAEARYMCAGARCKDFCGCQSRFAVGMSLICNG